MSLGQRKPRIELRSLFAWLFYVAVGLTITSSPATRSDPNLAVFGIKPLQLHWAYGLLAAASASIIASLIHASNILRLRLQDYRDDSTNIREALRWEIGLRVALVVVLVGCLLMQAVSFRDFIDLPVSEAYYGDVFAQFVWWLALLIVLSEAIQSASFKPVRTRRVLANLLAWIGLACFFAYVMLYQSTITFIVHVACRAIDAMEPAAFARYRGLTLQEEWLLLAVSLAATTSIAAALAIVSRGLLTGGLSGAKRRGTAAVTLLLVATASLYSAWYYGDARSWITPDLHEVGIGASWYQLFGGLLLAALAITFVTYRSWHSNELHSELVAGTIDRRLAIATTGESLITLVVLAIGASLYLWQSIAMTLRGHFLSAPLAQRVASLLLDPDVVILLALLLTSIRLMFLRWTGRAPGSLPIIPLQTREFIAAWLLLATIVAVAIPTFAAFSFSFWLGPWYRW